MIMENDKQNAISGYRVILNSYNVVPPPYKFENTTGIIKHMKKFY